MVEWWLLYIDKYLGIINILVIMNDINVRFVRGKYVYMKLNSNF